MIELTKNPGKDFIILNIADSQMSYRDWDDPSTGDHLKRIIDRLVEDSKPDLITVGGDLAYARSYVSYHKTGELLDGYGIPWAVIWGNHDNQKTRSVPAVVKYYTKNFKNFTYEDGDRKLGHGNYVIKIMEKGKPIEALIMMDTHDRYPYTAEDGTEKLEWAKLMPNQVRWYRKQIAGLKAEGCLDTTLMTHIPIYAYREAVRAAVKPGYDPRNITFELSESGECWNEGYKDTFGIIKDPICSYPEDEGMLDAILEGGTTKTVVAGHDHKNNVCIKYKGIRFVYGTKTGRGCYCTPELDGGTVFTVTKDGVSDVKHLIYNIE